MVRGMPAKLPVCNSLDAVIEFFGADWLAKKLYEQAGIEAVEVIE
jgi:hypothetical protein